MLQYRSVVGNKSTAIWIIIFDATLEPAMNAEESAKVLIASSAKYILPTQMEAMVAKTPEKQLIT